MTNEPRLALQDRKGYLSCDRDARRALIDQQVLRSEKFEKKIIAAIENQTDEQHLLTWIAVHQYPGWTRLRQCQIPWLESVGSRDPGHCPQLPANVIAGIHAYLQLSLKSESLYMDYHKP
jgi:hypothetical protein